MSRPPLAIVASCLCTLALPTLASQPRLTVEERVLAQEAIERVYHDYRIGEKGAFDQVVTRDLLEREVVTYLRQSVALQEYWHRPVTRTDLERELERIAENTAYPDRLQRLFTALGNDARLIHECLVRPVLVGRLARRLQASDTRFAGREWDEWWSEERDRLDPHRVVALDGFAPIPAPRQVEDLETCAWDNGSFDAVPPEMDSLSAVWNDGRLFVWGNATAYFYTGFSPSPWIYDPLTDSWIRGSSAEGPAAADWSPPAVFWTGSEYLVWWSDDRSSHAGEGALYDPIMDTWSPISSAGGPDRRSRYSTVWTGTELVVWGGWGSTYLGDGFRYSPASNSWQPVSTVGAPSPRRHHAAVWTGSEMIVWGGRGTAGALADGARYDPVSDTWRSMTSTGAPASRYESAATWTGAEMIVWGGRGETHLEIGDGGRYDPDQDEWTALPSSDAPSARRGHAMTWTEEELIVWGGRRGSEWFADGSRYHPGSNTWTPTSMSNAPEGRERHVATWTGSEMIVWGGASENSALRTGGRYDPASDMWVATADLPGMPTGGSNGTAVWTGSEMIVWGASGSNEGGRYDPVLDQWTSTTLVGVPEGRRQHTAIWTGTEMVVWGGVSDVATELNTGGRYDPVADTWTETSTSGAPGPRMGHSAVWTGTEMIVFGGAPTFYPCPGDELGDGAAYDPVSDSWNPIDTGLARSDHSAIWSSSSMIVWGGRIGTLGDMGECISVALEPAGAIYTPGVGWSAMEESGAPDPRAFHRALWTGSSMIVWGGEDYYSWTGTPRQMNTGGLYTASGDQWTPTSTSLAPLSRVGHTGVWTGAEMIVWGGGENIFADPRSEIAGGQYSPSVADTWFEIPIPEAPPPRTGHVAVWTGDLMIVWGGFGDNATSTGGRYRPGTDEDSDAVTCGDNCASVFNPRQNDLDLDGWGNVCDICVDSSDPLQHDSDGDGSGDACDCRPDDPDELPPGPVAPIMMSRTDVDVHTLMWVTTAGADVYAVHRGLISTLSTDNYGPCLVDGLTGTSFDDEELPPPGDGFTYLIQGRNSECGWGSLGFDSTESPRTNLSPNACN